MHNAKNLPLHLEESEEDNKHSSLDSCLHLPLFWVFCNVDSAARFMMLWNVLSLMADVNWLKKQTQHQQVQQENLPGDTTLDFLLNSYLCSSHLFIKNNSFLNQTLTPMLKLNRWPSMSSQKWKYNFFVHNISSPTSAIHNRNNITTSWQPWHPMLKQQNKATTPPLPAPPPPLPPLPPAPPLPYAKLKK